jgi:hypothetical protein
MRKRARERSPRSSCHSLLPLPLRMSSRETSPARDPLLLFLAVVFPRVIPSESAASLACPPWRTTRDLSAAFSSASAFGVIPNPVAVAANGGEGSAFSFAFVFPGPPRLWPIQRTATAPRRYSSRHANGNYLREVRREVCITRLNRRFFGNLICDVRRSMPVLPRPEYRVVAEGRPVHDRASKLIFREA